MSKQRATRAKKFMTRTRAARRLKAAMIALATITALTGVAVVAAARRDSSLPGVTTARLGALAQPVPLAVPTPLPPPPPASPSKEYVYVGGRLVATEEPVGVQSPYNLANTPWAMPGTIQAEDFDNGGEGIAYHDNNPQVANGAYRPGGVYLESCSDTAGCGYNVGSTSAGEWLEYTINVASAGTYNIEARVAYSGGGGQAGGTFRVEIDEVDKTGPLTIPNTGGYQIYQTVTKTNVSLTAGQHVMRVALLTNAPGGGFGNFNYFAISAPAPAGPPPSNLTASASSPTQVNLTWADNSANETGFRVERKTGNGSYSQITTVGASVTGYNDASASPVTTYTYRVRAYNAVGDSGNSNEASATTPDTLPAAPSSLTATPTSSSTVNLAWSDNSGNEAGFKVERKTGAGGTYSQIASLAAGVTGYSDSGLSGSTLYYYRVRAHNTAGDSAYSNVASATTSSAVPAPPSSLAATTVSTTQINLSWSDNSTNETGFKVERKTGSGSYSEITTVGAGVTTYSNTSLASSTNYYYRVRATNAAGDSTYSNEASATTANAAPSVSLTAPSGSAVFQAGANVTLSASASDPDGTITKVEFFRDSTLIAEDTSSPYSVAWNSVVAGSYSLTAKVTDNGGATTTSSAVNVTVNAPPTASVTSPAAGTVFAAPASITINASASDGDGTISKVEFYQGSTLLGQDTASPYSFAWNNVAAGVYSLTAKSFDNNGGVTTSAPVSVTVNALPSATLTAPANGATAQTGSTLQLTATASDADGTITKVEFYQGATKLSEDTTAPYEYAWGNVPSGTHTLTAKAFDNLGGSAVSSVVSVTVAATNDLVARWKLDETSGTTVSDASGYNNAATAQNMGASPAWGEGRTGGALAFDGTNDILGVAANASVAEVRNTFTVAFWAYPLSTHQIDTENTTDAGGAAGQRYVYEPTYQPGTEAGAGVSVGTNGVSVYEHGYGYMPATLVHQAPVSGWTHVAVVYENKQPKLYVNGVLVRTGLTSPRSAVAVQPQGVGGMAYGYFHGGLDDVRVYNRALSAAEIQAIMPAAPATLLADNFDDNSRDTAKWNILNAPTSVSVLEQNGRLEVTPTSTTTQYSGYAQIGSVNLTNARATVEVLQTTTPAIYADTLFGLWGGGGGLTFLAEGGNLIFQLHQGGVSQTSIIYDPVQHRFWRFRHDPATDHLVWETSPNHVVWTARRSIARPWSLTSEIVNLYSGTWAVYATPGTAIYDNLRVEQNQ